MSNRPDGCYRWVIEDAGRDPVIACWCGLLEAWMLPGDDSDVRRVHKVGVGGTLDSPPDVWEDDLPAAVTTVTFVADPGRGWMQAPVRIDPSIYGTDDPDARTMTQRGLRPLTSEEAEASLGRPLR